MLMEVHWTSQVSRAERYVFNCITMMHRTPENIAHLNLLGSECITNNVCCWCWRSAQHPTTAAARGEKKRNAERQNKFPCTAMNAHSIFTMCSVHNKVWVCRVVNGCYTTERKSRFVTEAAVCARFHARYYYWSRQKPYMLHCSTQYAMIVPHGITIKLPSNMWECS